MTAPNDVLEIFETNFIRAVSRNSVVLTRVAQICCFGNCRNTISLKKTEEIRVTEYVSETSKTLFILWFHVELIYRGPQNVASEISERVSLLSQISPKDGHKVFLQKFPKQFL